MFSTATPEEADHEVVGTPLLEAFAEGNSRSLVTFTGAETLFF